MNRLLGQTPSVLPKPTAIFLSLANSVAPRLHVRWGAPGEKVTGVETPPVGDARQVPRTLVRRLDELCRFTLEFSFSLDNRDYQQLAELLLQGEEKGESRALSRVLDPFVVRITRPRLSRGGDRVLSPLSSRYFPTSSI